MVLLGSSFVKVSSNVVEEFCRDIALILVIFVSPTPYIDHDQMTVSNNNLFLSLSMMALRSFLAKWRLEFDIDSSTDPSKRAQFSAKSVFSLHLNSSFIILSKIYFQTNLFTR